MVGVGVPCADMVFGGRRQAVVEWWFRASSRVMDVVVGKLQAARLSRGRCHHHQERKAVSGQDSALQPCNFGAAGVWT